jgi:replicative DNA helicase
MLVLETHRQIFEVIGGLMEAGRNVTRSALESRLPAEYGDGEPFMPLVMVLKENAADAGSALDYAEAIREDFTRKQLAKAADAAMKACRDPGKMTSDIIANLEAHI